MNKTQAKAIIFETVQVIPSVLPYLSDKTRAALKAGYIEGGVPEINALKKDRIAGDLSSINKKYHDTITRVLIAYFEGGAVAPARASFREAMLTAFGDAYDMGWLDGGATLPIDDEDALGWLEARLNQESSYIGMLFEQVKQLRKEANFDFFTWATARADGYTNTLKEVYNNARLRAMPNMMVTFDGDDGKESCETCQMLKGKRHKISWFIKNEYVPPFGSNLDCAKGGHCEHGLKDDKGDWVTI